MVEVGEDVIRARDVDLGEVLSEPDATERILELSLIVVVILLAVREHVAHLHVAGDQRLEVFGRVFARRKRSRRRRSGNERAANTFQR